MFLLHTDMGIFDASKHKLCELKYTHVDVLGLPLVPGLAFGILIPQQTFFVLPEARGTLLWNALLQSCKHGGQERRVIG